MKRFHVLGLALVAVLAFGAFTASSAFALTFALAQWLINGALVAAELPYEWSAEFLFEDTSFGALECSRIFDGTIGPNSLSLITKVLSLTGAEVTLAAPLSCTSVKSCEAGTATIAPEKLPWDTEVELDTETGTFIELALGAEYSTRCRVLGFFLEDTCNITENEDEVKNVAGGVEFGPNPTPNGNCTLGGANTGVFEILAGNVVKSSEGTVSVSE